MLEAQSNRASVTGREEKNGRRVSNVSMKSVDRGGALTS